jgi:hypothetical protein
MIPIHGGECCIRIDASATNNRARAHEVVVITPPHTHRWGMCFAPAQPVSSRADKLMNSRCIIAALSSAATTLIDVQLHNRAASGGGGCGTS